MLATLTGGQSVRALNGFEPDAVGPTLGIPDGLLRGKSPGDYIRDLARDFAGHTPALAIGGGTAAAQSNGLFNLEAIYALNYLVGSAGRNPSESRGGLLFNPGSPVPGLPPQSNVNSLAELVCGPQLRPEAETPSW